MENPSSTYTLAQELFDVYRNKSGLLTSEEIADSGVRVQAGHITNVEGIVAFGVMNDDRASQRLSLGKNGVFFLSTVYDRSHPSYLREHITPTSNSDINVLLDSFLYKHLLKLLEIVERSSSCQV